MIRKSAGIMLVCLALFLTGCMDKKEIENLNAQLAEQSLQNQSLQAENNTLKSEVESLKSIQEKSTIENLLLKDQLSAIALEKTELLSQVKALENELEIKNEAALLEIQVQNDYNAKILSLKKTASLKSLVSAYKGPIEGSAVAHYGSCLYEAAKREGSTAFIALINGGDFEFVDGIVGHFAQALAKTTDLNYKTQLMVEASALDGTQSPTTLYFYARVLYFLSRI